MKHKFLNLVATLAIVTSAHAQNNVPQEVGTTTSRPTMQDMLQWKSDYLTKFKNVTYLNEEGQPISEALFFQRVVNERRGFSQQFSPDGLVLRFLSDTETKPRQAGTQ